MTPQSQPNRATGNDQLTASPRCARLQPSGVALMVPEVLTGVAYVIGLALLFMLLEM